MHQSGHSRAHSMQTVQFSSLRAMTPRARAGGSSRSWGYCVVWLPLSIVRNVTPSPLTSPGISGTSEHHLEDASDEDVHEREGYEVLPRERLELVLAQPRVGEPDPVDEEGDEHDLGAEHERADHVGQLPARPDARQVPPAEEQRGGDGGKGERARRLGHVEEEVAQSGVLGEVAG